LTFFNLKKNNQIFFLYHVYLPLTDNNPGYVSPQQMHALVKQAGNKPSLREVMTTSTSPTLLPPNSNNSHYATPSQLQQSRTTSVPPPVQAPVVHHSPKSAGIEEKFAKLFGTKVRPISGVFLTDVAKGKLDEYIKAVKPNDGRDTESIEFNKILIW
jgi:hypothetical protein